MKTLVSLACVLGVVVCLVPPMTEAQVITLKLPTIVGPSSPVTISAYKFKEIAEAKSKGQLKIEVYPSGQLAANENIIMEGLQLGTLDLGPVLTSSIGGKWDAKFAAFDVPFFWRTRKQVFAVTSGPVGRSLIDRLDQLGAKGFCYGGGYSFRSVLSNKRPTNLPADLRGQTVRVPPIPTMTELFKSLGANAVPMAWGEIYLAMSQGTVDAVELPTTTVTSDKFYEVGKYYSLTRHSYWPTIWLIAKARYASLPADMQRVIDETMAASCAFSIEIEEKQEEEALALMRSKGVKVNEISDLKAFQDAAKPVYKTIEQKIGKEMFDQVISAGEAANK